MHAHRRKIPSAHAQLASLPLLFSAAAVCVYTHLHFPSLSKVQVWSVEDGFACMHFCFFSFNGMSAALMLYSVGYKHLPQFAMHKFTSIPCRDQTDQFYCAEPAVICKYWLLDYLCKVTQKRAQPKKEKFTIVMHHILKVYHTLHTDLFQCQSKVWCFRVRRLKWC